jgi:hypothetical protein
MTLCLGHSASSTLQCKKNPKCQKEKIWTNMNGSSWFIGILWKWCYFPGVDSMSSICKVCSCGKQRRTTDDWEWKLTESLKSLKTVPPIVSIHWEVTGHPSMLKLRRFFNPTGAQMNHQTCLWCSLCATWNSRKVIKGGSVMIWENYQR